jgi:hypothetical protein
VRRTTALASLVKVESNYSNNRPAKERFQIPPTDSALQDSHIPVVVALDCELSASYLALSLFSHNFISKQNIHHIKETSTMTFSGRYQFSGPSPFPTPKDANVPSLPFQQRGIPLVRGSKAEDKRETKKKPQRRV